MLPLVLNKANQMAMFCPNCGSVKGPFFRGLCSDCFLKKNSLFELPQKIQIQKCKSCGKILVSGKWLAQENSLLEKVILKNAKVSDLKTPVFSFDFSEKEKKISAKVKVSGKIDSNGIEQEKETAIEFLNVLCDSCMKAVSNYFEATIQLRFENPALEESVLKEIEKMLSGFSKEDVLAKIVSTKNQRSGIDLVLGSKKSASKIAKAIAKKHNARLVVSFKQAKGGTRDETKRRFTYCIRIGGGAENAKRAVC